MPTVRQHAGQDPLFTRLIQAIVAGDAPEVTELIASSPALVRQCLAEGATRQRASDFFFREIAHYLYAGDTALHAAAAGYRLGIAKTLVEKGAPVIAANRRGAQPLHYAADGAPRWNSAAQANVIVFPIDAGADPNALDKSGVAPLHRAVRQRCAGAVDALLRNGAVAGLKNKNGSTPLHLAVQNTGKGGTGSPESKAMQKNIIELLLKAGASPKDKDGRGKTTAQCAISDWIRALL